MVRKSLTISPASFLLGIPNHQLHCNDYTCSSPLEIHSHTLSAKAKRLAFRTWWLKVLSQPFNLLFTAATYDVWLAWHAVPQISFGLMPAAGGPGVNYTLSDAHLRISVHGSRALMQRLTCNQMVSDKHAYVLNTHLHHSMSDLGRPYHATLRGSSFLNISQHLSL